MFGYLLFAFGLFFVAAFMRSLDPHRDERDRARSDQIISILLLVMIGWLVPIANSKTSTLSLIAGIAVIVALRFPAVRRHLWSYAVAAILLATVSNELLSVQSAILESSGRDATFTGRTGLWETLLKEPTNPLTGVGYASFWLGERQQRFWAMYPTSPPIEAHNGYLEIYINLGLIGLLLIGGVLWTGLSKMRSKVTASLSMPATRDDEILRTFGMAYGVAYLLYNVTEATFSGLNFLFLIFLILTFNYRHARVPVQRLSTRV